MVDSLADDMIADLKELFALADADSSGMLSTKEVRWVMQSVGRNPSEAELADIVSSVDTDGNGFLDVNEFVSLMARKFKEVDSMEEVLESFKVFDKDANGMISSDELKSIMHEHGSGLSHDEIAVLIRECDSDGDGNINYEEFVAMLMSK